MTGRGVVTVLGSHKVEENSGAYKDALEIGRMIAEAGFTVCNGGYAGIMEASARGANEAGGKTLGITTKQFPGKVNAWIQEEQSTATWDERLLKLIEVADAFVFFDGGTGTLTELFVAWEKTNKKIINKPIFVLGAGLRKFVENLRDQPAIVWNEHLKLIETPQGLREYLATV